jgi:sulfoxide reductase heme-binding subunit YedZ
LVSRAAGVVGLVLISLSVLLGLALAARVVRRPGLKRAVARLHEHVALTALGAIAVHGLSLLGDHWLNPGLRGIAVPFALGYRPRFTGMGIIAGYFAVLVGPSFYIRRRLGAARWRRLHRATIAVWVLSVIHTLGAGSDASRPWLRCLVLAPVLPIVYLLVLRATARAARTAGSSRRRPVARKIDPERRPLPQVGLGADGPAVGLDDRARDCEAEAAAATIA